MNFYRQIANRIGTREAQALSDELSAWHDEMVAHDRASRSLATGDRCDDDCAHAEARRFWQAARAVFGTAAGELEFLRRHGSVPRARRALSVYTDAPQ